MPIKSARRVIKNRRKSIKQTPQLTKYLLAVLIVVSSLGILMSFVTYNFLNQKFVSAQFGSDTDFLNKTSFTLAYVKVKDFTADPIIVESINLKVFDTQAKKVFSYDVPADLKINYTSKHNGEEIKNIFALRSLDSENPIQNGIIGLNTAFFRLFAVPIDKFVYVDLINARVFDDYFENGNVLNLLSMQVIEDLSSNIFTDLKLSDFYQLGQFVSGLPSDRILLRDYSVFSDDDVREINISSYFAQTGDTIAVLNSSGVEGLATFGARVIRNMGGRIVAVNNSDQQYETSLIVTDTPENPTVSTLSKLFSINNIISKDRAKQVITNSELDRSDIIIIFGFDKDGAF